MTFVPNQPVEDRLIYVFESLEAITSRKFRQFFECFSPMAIRSILPSRMLLDARRAPAPAKLSTKINGYPIAADRNVLSQAVGGVLQLIWDSIDGDQDNELFLPTVTSRLSHPRTCCEPRTRCCLSAASTDERLAAAAVKPATRKSVLEHQERSDREQPVVILGRIGHGKSTFLKYLRHVEAKDVLSKQYIQIDVDFLRTPLLLPRCPALS